MIKSFFPGEPPASARVRAAVLLVLAGLAGLCAFGADWLAGIVVSR